MKKDDKDLKAEETRLMKQLKEEEAELRKLTGASDPWGEDDSSEDQLHVHLKPLPPHQPPIGFFGEMMSRMFNRHHHPNAHLFEMPQLAMFKPPLEIEGDDEPASVENISINISAPSQPEEPKRKEEEKAEEPKSPKKSMSHDE